MSLKLVVEDLKQIFLLLSNRGFTRARELCVKAQSTLSGSQSPKSMDEDYAKVYNQLLKKVDALKKCASISSPGNPDACVNEARAVYKLSLLLNLISTGNIRKLIRARRAAYVSIALGLPTAALFGFPLIAIALVFFGVLWTYFHFTRLKLIAWFTLVSSLMVLLPFLVNAFMYFTQAILTPEEVNTVAQELNLPYTTALIVLIALLAISTASLLLAMYAITMLIRYYSVFS